ncbi:MAG: hypothetical protein FWD78_02875 [Treponema sp.]|nr:hypothetical protein [Treponema sp.]
MKAIAQHYYGTTEEWLKFNPVVYNAVLTFEIVTRQDGSIYRKVKVGDGKRRWSDLPTILDESKPDALADIQKRLIAVESILEILKRNNK